MTEFDCHVHLDYDADVDGYAAGLRKLKMRAGVSSCGSFFNQPGNDAVEAAFRRHPDVFAGFGYVALGRGDTAKTVERLHRRGFPALKVIIPKKDYDDRSFYPIYRRAEALGMPILFHTGVMVRPECFLEFSPRCPKVDHAAMDVSCRRMDPMCLDTIARAFPKLKLIMAHFGSTGRRDYAAGILAWNPNIYADLTALVWLWEKERVKRAVEWFRTVPAKVHERLLFGTDTFVGRGLTNMPRQRKSVLDLLKASGVKKSLIPGIMGGTMNAMFGLED
jgi:hypothetical protein